MQVNVINISNNQLPKYETPQSAGLDVRADFSRITPQNPIKLFGEGEIIFNGEGHSKVMLRLEPGSRALIPTGLFTAIPDGYEIQVRPRSGLALKNCITVLNTPGTIDSDYRGEVGIILINHSDVPFTVKHHDRIAQLVFAKCESAVYNVVSTLDETERGCGGFGSTGV